MRKNIIKMAGILFAALFLLLIIQACEVAPTADYVGTWECVTVFSGSPVPSKIVITAESSSFQFDWYNKPVTTWEWAWSGKGTVTVSGSTMTLTFTHLKDFLISTDWIDSSDPNWAALVATYILWGKTTLTGIYAVSSDGNNLFLYSTDVAIYSGDALHFDLQ